MVSITKSPTDATHMVHLLEGRFSPFQGESSMPFQPSLSAMLEEKGKGLVLDNDCERPNPSSPSDMFNVRSPNSLGPVTHDTWSI